MTTFSLQNRNLPKDSFDTLKTVLERRFSERLCGVADKADINFIFEINDKIEKDSYNVKDENGSVLVSADCVSNVFAGVGRFLLKGLFDGKGGFCAPSLPIEHRMKKSVRGIYLASHFYNFHHNAPMEEECQHIAEQALRGFNALMMVVAMQHYNSYDEPEAREMIERVKKQLAFGRRCGMSSALILFSNTGFANYPKSLAANMEPDEHGHYLRKIYAEFITEVCPSLPGGLEYCRDAIEAIYKAFSGEDIKYFYIWPYDEGGCQCDACYPWPTNGFMRVADAAREMLPKYFPDASLCISTWHFNVNNPNEWDDFYAHLAKGEYNWAPYVMTCFQSGRLPGVIAKNGIPDGVRFVDFPEISMQNPAKPWGGYGANPIPMYLNNVEENIGAYNNGGYLYSEGRYEDINKFIVAGFYCGYYTHTADCLKDYFRSEFSVTDEFTLNELVRACQLMESSLKRDHIAPADENDCWHFRTKWGTAIPEVKKIIDRVDAVLPEAVEKSWRWRLLFIRANLDYVLYSNGYKFKDSEYAQTLLRELCGISYVCENTKFCVNPPLGI